jgi:hypothetical protein
MRGVETLRFALLTRPDKARMFLRPGDEGLVLTDATLAWHEGLARVERPLDDIRALNLRLSVDALGRASGAMRIGFADGRALTVFGSGPGGRRDPVRAAAYRDFAEALHARLTPEMRARILFLTGVSSLGATVAKLALLVMVVGLVAVVAALVPHLARMEASEVLFLLVVLPLMVVPFWRMVSANAGRPYAPDRLPGKLLP